MKIIKNSPFKMKYQSPLKDNGDEKVVNSAGGGSEITAHGMPVYDDSGNPISPEKMKYFENLNKLYPEHIYNRDKTPTGEGSDKGYPGFRVEEVDGKKVLMPKSTSISHWKTTGKQFYTQGMDSLAKTQGYNISKDLMSEAVDL